MWVQEYVIFVLQPPPTNGILPPPITVTFNSWEIYEVSHDRGTDIELWTSEIGTSNSVVKVNGKSFMFQVDANYRPETRKKVLEIFHYVSKGCQITFTFNKFNSYVPTYAQDPNYTPSDLNVIPVTIPYACISLLSKPIDSTHNGASILIGENSTVEFIVKEAVDPLELMPCKKLSMSDFALAPWILDNDGTGWYLNTLFVEASGYIEKFLDHPDGTFDTVPVTTTGMVNFSSINPAGNVMLYTDDSLSYLVDGQMYEVNIPNIKVKLKTGETCHITFTQQFEVHF